MEHSFADKNSDHRILAITHYLQKSNPTRKVIFISKDINLRMKAKSLGLMAQDYLSDKVQDLDILKKEIEMIENVDDALVQRLYETQEGIDPKEINLKPHNNQYFIIRSTKSSALGHYNPSTNTIGRVEKVRAYGIDPRNSEQTFSLDALMRPDIRWYRLPGKRNRKPCWHLLLPCIRRAVLTRSCWPGQCPSPIAILAISRAMLTRRLAHMQPLFDNLTVIKNKFKSNSREYQYIERFQRTERLVITPLAYIRGGVFQRLFYR